MPSPNPLAVAASSSNQDPARRIFSQSGGPVSAYARHLQATSNYLRYYGGKIVAPEKGRSERDILEEHHQFIREYGPGDEENEEKRLVRSYYQKLYREFAVVELVRWEEKQIAMRWRTKEEVLAGKGQFLCANLSCQNHESTLDEDPDDSAEREGGKKGLRGFELLFEYVERNEKKSALVKVRVCDQCAIKLRYIQSSDERKHRKSKDNDEDKSKRSKYRSRSRGRDRKKRRRDGREVTRNDGRSRSRRRYEDLQRRRSSKESERRKDQRRSRSPKKADERHKSRHYSRD